MADYVVADELGELYPILLYLADYLLVGEPGEIWVCDAVGSDLVSLIYRAYLIGRYLGVVDSDALADKLRSLSEGSRIKIEGTLKTVFIE